MRNMCINNNIINFVSFQGLAREISYAFQGDESEVIFHEMEEAKLRNILDFPYVIWDWIICVYLDIPGSPAIHEIVVAQIKFL